MKGYEIEPGQYVIVDQRRDRRAAPKASRTIDIEDFVDLSDIDPVYFEQPYYLMPDKDAAKPYRLLVDVMNELGKVAIGRFVMRSKERARRHPPSGWLLLLETMRYADEVLARRPRRAARRATSSPASASWRWHASSWTPSSGEFDPEKYHDEYREELLALIERKAAGEEIVAPAAPEEPAKVLDLMAALEASLARSGAKSGSDAGTAPAESTRARKAAKRTPAKKAAARQGREREEGAGEAGPEVGLIEAPATRPGARAA